MAEIGMKAAAGIMLALIGLTLVIVGVCFLAYSIAVALTPALGAAGGAAVTGGIFVGPPFIWAIIILAFRRPPPPKPKPVAEGSLWMTLFAAVAKETPWVAIVGAGLVAAAEIFLLSGGRRKK